MLITQNRFNTPQKTNNTVFGAKEGFVPSYVRLAEKSLGLESIVFDGNKTITPLSNHAFLITNVIDFGKYENTFISLKKKFFGNYVIKGPVNTITQWGTSSKNSTLSPALDWKTLKTDEAEDLLIKAFKKAVSLGYKKQECQPPQKTGFGKIWGNIKNLLSFKKDK